VSVPPQIVLVTDMTPVLERFPS